MLGTRVRSAVDTQAIYSTVARTIDVGVKNGTIDPPTNLPRMVSLASKIAGQKSIDAARALEPRAFAEESYAEHRARLHPAPSITDLDADPLDIQIAELRLAGLKLQQIAQRLALPLSTIKIRLVRMAERNRAR